MKINEGRIRSRYSGIGYFSNDNRASGGVLEEDDLVGCSHCQALIRRREWKLKGGYCRECDQELCLTCAESARLLGCSNFKRTVERKWELMHRPRAG